MPNIVVADAVIAISLVFDASPKSKPPDVQFCPHKKLLSV